MTRTLRLSLAIALAGCMTRFSFGPAATAVPERRVSVRIDGCRTPPELFDCASAPAVGVYLQDYFKLNGIAPPEKPAAGTVAAARIFERTGVVAVAVTLSAPSGIVWSAEAEGDTLLRALVRLEALLADRASLRSRLLTHPKLDDRVKELGRSEVSAERNRFTYR
jgi:hypothetical protein